MKLYGSLTSPYVRKVRAFLAEKGIDYDFAVEAPTDPAGSVQRHPLHQIPALHLDDGDVMFDSPVICEYLDGLRGDRLIPAAGSARVQALRWHALAQGLCEAVVARLQESRRAPERRDENLMRNHELRIASGLAYAEQKLPAGQPLAGDRFGFADLALAAALEYIDFRHPHDWRSRHPRLAQWLAPLSERPSLVATRPPAA